jgi:hypothetical protein
VPNLRIGRWQPSRLPGPCRLTNAEADERSIDCSLRSLLFDWLAA